MHPNRSDRDSAIATLQRDIRVYALCDLDGVPIYVGQSVDGIQARVRRHLTSARSDIIANRQLDVWEVAYVMAWPAEREAIAELEATLYHHRVRVRTAQPGAAVAKLRHRLGPPRPWRPFPSARRCGTFPLASRGGAGRGPGERRWRVRTI